MFYTLATRRLTRVSLLTMAVCVLAGGIIGCRPPGSVTTENAIVAGGEGQARSVAPKGVPSGKLPAAPMPAVAAAQMPMNDRELLKELLTLEQKSYYAQKQEANRVKLRQEQLRRQKLRQGLKRESSASVPGGISTSEASSASTQAL